MMFTRGLKMLPKLLLLLSLVGCASNPPPEPTGLQCRIGLKLHCEYYAGDEKCVCVNDRQVQDYLDDLYEEDW